MRPPQARRGLARAGVAAGVWGPAVEGVGAGVRGVGAREWGVGVDAGQVRVEGVAAGGGPGASGSARVGVGAVGAGVRGTGGVGAGVWAGRDPRRAGRGRGLAGRGRGLGGRGRRGVVTRTWRHRAGGPGGSPSGHPDRNRGEQPPRLCVVKPEFPSGAPQSRPGHRPGPGAVGRQEPALSQGRWAAEGERDVRGHWVPRRRSPRAPARGQPLSQPPPPNVHPEQGLDFA